VRPEEKIKVNGNGAALCGQPRASPEVWPKAFRMQMTAAYAARTPRLTDAMTVAKRRTGIMSEITIDQP
jgi:hypothetical protein